MMDEQNEGEKRKKELAEEEIEGKNSHQISYHVTILKKKKNIENKKKKA